VLIAAEIASEQPAGARLRYALFPEKSRGCWATMLARLPSPARISPGAQPGYDRLGSNGDRQVDLYIRRGNGGPTGASPFATRVVDAYGLNLVPEVIDNGAGRAAITPHFGGQGSPPSWLIEPGGF
jgi:hypothetical protein